MAWSVCVLLLASYKLIVLSWRRSWRPTQAKLMCLTSAVFGAFNIVCFSLAEVGCGYMDPEHTTELGVVFISSILLGIIPFVMYSGWFSLLVVSLCFSISKWMRWAWHAVTALLVLTIVGVGGAFLAMTLNDMNNSHYIFSLATAVSCFTSVVVMACFAALYWRFFRRGWRLAPRFLYKLKKLWICSLILLVVLITGSIIEGMWTAGVISVVSLKIEIYWSILEGSYLSAHCALMFMISSSPPPKSALRLSAIVRQSVQRSSGSDPSSHSSDPSSHSSDRSRGSSYAELDPLDSDDESSLWIDPFVRLPQVDKRPLLSDVSSI